MENPGAKPPILAVDDEPTNIKVLDGVLSQLDVQTITAGSGPEAIEKAKNREFALILMDVNMPNMNGFKTARAIQKSTLNSETPIIFITALGPHGEHESEGYRSGAVDFLFKPINFDILRSKVNVFLKIYLHKEALRITSERLNLFMESTTDCITIFDNDMRIVKINQNSLNNLGYSEQEAIGKNILEITPELVETDRYEKYRDVINSGSSYFSTYMVPNPEHGDKHYFIKAFKLGDGLGIVESDITNQKNAELERSERLAEQERAKIVDQMSDGLMIIAMDGTVTSVNPAFIKLTGYSREEIIGTNYSEILMGLLKAKYRSSAQKQFDTAMDINNQSEAECVIKTKDGREIPILLSISFLKDNDKKPGAVICSIKDFTEYKKVENKLLEKDKALTDQNTLLTRKNITLRELMNQLEETKSSIESNIQSNVDRLILPTLKKVRSKGSNIEQEYIDLLKDNLEAIISPFSKNISRQMYKLTQKEIELCNLLKSNFTSKEIGGLMGISIRTVETHRARIRKKLGIRNKEVNMASYLSSM